MIDPTQLLSCSWTSAVSCVRVAPPISQNALPRSQHRDLPWNEPQQTRVRSTTSERLSNLPVSSAPAVSLSRHCAPNTTPLRKQEGHQEGAARKRALHSDAPKTSQVKSNDNLLTPPCQRATLRLTRPRRPTTSSHLTAFTSRPALPNGSAQRPHLELHKSANPYQISTYLLTHLLADLLAPSSRTHMYPSAMRVSSIRSAVPSKHLLKWLGPTCWRRYASAEVSQSQSSLAVSHWQSLAGSGHVAVSHWQSLAGTH